VLAATLLCGCGISGVSPNNGSSDSESDNAVDTSQYTGADVDSVDLVEITDTESPDGCREWHVQLTADVNDPDQAPGTAWFSGQTCVDDESDPGVSLSVIKLTDAQLSDFRNMLDQVKINTWNPWMQANTDQADIETPTLPYYMVAVLVDNNLGIFYDTVTVMETMPPNWDQFVSAIKTLTGDTSG